MKQQNSKTKKTLLSAVIVLIVCVAMLLGTTFAWFSDSVSNTGNRIQAGTLKIDLLMHDGTDYKSIANGTGDIFKADAGKAQDSNNTLWEPGKTQVVFLAVENKGNLAVKYKAYIDVTDEGLCDDGNGVSSLECVMLGGVDKDAYEALGITNWSDLKTKAEALGAEVKDVKAGRTIIDTGVLDEIAKGVTNEKDYVALAVHMKEDAGNVYQGKDAIIDVNIVATQMTAENDGFGSNTYDAQAEGAIPPFPVYANVKTTEIKQVVSENEKIDFDTTKAQQVESATIQGSASNAILTQEKAKPEAEGAQEVKVVLNLHAETVETTETTMTIDISMDKIVSITKDNNTVTKNPEPVTELAGLQTSVFEIGGGLRNVKVTHSHESVVTEMPAKSAEEVLNSYGYHYDSVTGKLTITTNKFSPFTVSFEQSVAKIVRDGEPLYYATLEDAISVVREGETIILTKNIDNAPGIAVNTEKSFTIDFNNKTYTVNKPGAGSTGTATQAFQLLSGQTITFKNGTINVSEDNLTEAVSPAKNIKRLFQSYANVTFEDMTIDGTNLYGNNAAIEFACGNVSITGCTNITAKKDVKAINVDTWKDYYPAGAHVTIDTTGKIDAIYCYSEGSGAGYTKSTLAISNGIFEGITDDGSGDVTVTLTGGIYHGEQSASYLAPGHAFYALEGQTGWYGICKYDYIQLDNEYHTYKYTKADGTVVKENQKHSFDGNGVCTKCGFENTIGIVQIHGDESIYRKLTSADENSVIDLVGGKITFDGPNRTLRLNADVSVGQIDFTCDANGHGGLILDLNGHVLTCDSWTALDIYKAEGATKEGYNLIINDSNPSILHEGYIVTKDNCFGWVEKEYVGTCTQVKAYDIYGGIITNKGFVKPGEPLDGAGISTVGNVCLTMNGGTVAGCYSNGDIGGICMNRAWGALCELTLNGNAGIVGCSAAAGGIECINSNLTMNDNAHISYCTAGNGGSYPGGAIQLAGGDKNNYCIINDNCVIEYCNSDEGDMKNTGDSAVIGYYTTGWGPTFEGTVELNGTTIRGCKGRTLFFVWATETSRLELNSVKFIDCPVSGSFTCYQTKGPLVISGNTSFKDCNTFGWNEVFDQNGCPTLIQGGDFTTLLDSITEWFGTDVGVIISGGKFTVARQTWVEAHLADGYKVKSNGDGTISVVAK